MARASQPQDDFEKFRTEYAAPSSDVALRVERDACGHAVGLNGYTTLRHAEILAEGLNLRPEATVLDLGGQGGAGPESTWPK
jgi:hypothetical protein